MCTGPSRTGERSRGARLAGAAGNAVEWYDFAVFGASATLVAAAIAPERSDEFTAVLAVWAIAFVVRPLGAVLGAEWADRSGRRGPLVATVLVMSLASAAVGLLPSGAWAGGVVALLLLALRAVQGLATGAELVISVAYLTEQAPEGRRGLWGGAHLSTLALGYAAGIGTVVAVAATLPADAVASWGWRLPFLLALPLGLVMVVVRHRATESPDFEVVRSASVDQPWWSAVRALRGHRDAVVRSFLLASALTCAVNLWFVYVPARLAYEDELAAGPALAGAIVGLLTLSVSAVVCGHWSDVVGRRPVIAAGLATHLLLWTFGYPSVDEGMVPLALLQAVAGAGMGALVVQATISEAFPAPLRAAGIAVSLGLATSIVGGTAPMVAELLTGVGPGLVQVYAVLWLAAAAASSLREPVPVSSLR